MELMSARLEYDSVQERVDMAVELLSDDPAERLRGLRAAGDRLDVWRRELVGAARERGVPWSAIGEALGMTKQAAWEFYNADLRRALDEARARSGLGDEDVLPLVDEERRAVRARRSA